MNSSIIRLLLGSTLLLGASAVATADIIPNYYLRMGEDDGQSVPGPVTALKDSVGTATTSAFSFSPAPRYSTEVSPEAAARTGSTVCLDLLSGGRYLTSSVGWSLHWDACVELWVQPAAATGTAAIVSYGTGGSDGWSLMQIDGQFRARIGGAWFGSVPAIPGHWVHLAMVRDGDTGTLYADGVACGSAAVADSFSSGLLTIGALPPACTTDFFRGRLDELRYSHFNAGAFDPAHDLLLHGPRLLVELAKDGTKLEHRSTLALNADHGYSATLTLRNSGATKMQGINVSVTGIDASQFSLSPAVPASLTLGAGESTTFTVSLAASSRGISRGNLHIATSLSAPPFCDLALEGERPAPALSVSADGQEIQQGLLLLPPVNLYDNAPVPPPVPAGLSDLRSVAIGIHHFTAVRADGTVTAWGGNKAHECDVPKNLNNVIQVAAGYRHTTALKKDGKVVSWGDNFGPTPAALSGVVLIAAAGEYSAALKKDGSVVIWGKPPYGYDDIQNQKGVVAMSARNDCFAVLKADGTVAAWNQETRGDIPGITSQQGVTGVAISWLTTTMVKKDGTVMQVGPSRVNVSKLSQVTAASWSADALYLLHDDDSLQKINILRSDITYRPGGRIRSLATGFYYGAAIYDPGFTFPARTAPGESRTQTITLKNTGAQLLSVGTFTLTGPDAADFTIDQNGRKTFLDPRTGETTFQVIFHPRSAGLRRARLDIASNDPQRPVFSLALTGTCADPVPAVSLFAQEDAALESPLDPGGVQVLPAAQNLRTSSERSFLVRNDDGAPLEDLQVLLTGIDGGEADPGFQLAPPVETELAPGAAAEFTLRFKPEITVRHSTGERRVRIAIRRLQTELASLECSARLLDSYAGWRQIEFGGQVPTSDASETADPDHDGIPNLLEYALNGDPQIGEDSANVLPQLTMGGDPAHPRPVLSFSYHADRPGQALRVMATANLVNDRWVEIARGVDGQPFRALVSGVTITESSDGPVKGVKIAVSAVGEPAGTKPFRFLRLVADSNW